MSSAKYQPFSPGLNMLINHSTYVANFIIVIVVRSNRHHPHEESHEFVDE